MDVAEKPLKFKFTPEGRKLWLERNAPAEKKAPRRVWVQPGRLETLREGDLVRDAVRDRCCCWRHWASYRTSLA